MTVATNYDKYIYSRTIHYIANSGKDENNRYKGGKAGDQSKHEAELRKWYNRPWTCILRYPIPEIGLLIARLSIDMCLNDNIGYDQTNRKSYWRELKKNNYDPMQITTPCEEDCTAGVSANVKAAGFIASIQSLQDIPICSSRNMRKEFVKAGFQCLRETKYVSSPKYLLPGDILLYETHHAACNISYGKNIEGEMNTVRITGKSVNIRSEPNSKSRILGLAYQGDHFPYAFSYCSDGRGWYKINFNDKDAWVTARYSILV